MLSVAILWHMHQPYYVNPLTRKALMPWVRMHAVKGYLDMITMAKRHPETRMVFNLTPVLIRQVQELVKGEISDLWEEWTRVPAKELTPELKCNLLENFFKANWDNLIRPHQRYHELLAKRGYDLMHLPLAAIAPSFSRQDCLDLQVWYNLAWCGYAACAEFPELRELKAKGRNFTEDDKLAVLAVHRRILETLLPRYRALLETGQIEITTTPYYHPISPLVFDSNVALRCMPWASLPPRFHWPVDVESQVRLAVEQHREVFGRPPVGLWPSEGSVCPELIPIWKELGIEWFATDEEILFKSLARDSAQATARVQLYDPYVAAWGGSSVASVFRDRVLSDFVGFSASRNSADDAATFILQRIHEIAHATESRPNPLVAIVLDGENAWEYFPDGGEGFLDRWYTALTSEKRWGLTTLADYIHRPIQRQSLGNLHTGSWIQANFDIWIGDPEENLAWQLLGETRSWWEKQRSKVTPEIEKRVWQEIYAAEGSDWFWWYGPDFQTDNDLMFDELFRTHLQNVYLLCGAKPPESLSQIICRPVAIGAVQNPIGLVQPKLDGIQTTFFEWHEAGRYDATQARGAMFHGDRVVRNVYFGFDLEHFYLRLDRFPELGSRAGLYLRVHVGGQEAFEYDWSPTMGTIAPANQRARDHSQVAFRKIVELSIPFAALGCVASDRVNFFISVAGKDPSGNLLELERHPSNGELQFQVPDAVFAAANWSA